MNCKVDGPLDIIVYPNSHFADVAPRGGTDVEGEHHLAICAPGETQGRRTGGVLRQVEIPPKCWQMKIAEIAVEYWDSRRRHQCCTEMVATAAY